MADLESLKAKLITPGRLVDLYQVGQVRGKGGFATVREGVDKKTSRAVALKILNPKAYLRDARQARQVFQEIEILSSVQKLGNSNVLDFVAAHEDTSATTGLPRLTIVSQLCDGGELFDRVVAAGHFSEKEAAELIKKIAVALKQLHQEAGIVHRDLKPENILFVSKAADAEPCIADFGLSLVKGKEDLHSGLIGTPSYLAPEAFVSRRYTEATDIWALGVIAYILLCGYPPFYSEKRGGPEQHAELMAQTRLGPVFHADAWGEISESARHLVASMLTVDEARRITVDGIVNHPWITTHAPTTTKHLATTVSKMREFNAKRKIKAAALAVRVGAAATTNLRSRLASLLASKSEGASGSGSSDFTTEKLGELSTAFNKVAGQGGSVNKEQLSSVLASLGLGHLPADRIFEVFDEDGSGDIDYRELLCGLTMLGGGSSASSSSSSSSSSVSAEEREKEEAAALKMAFNLFDADGSGEISLPELIRLLQMLHHHGHNGGQHEEATAATATATATAGAGATATGNASEEEEEEEKALEALFRRIDQNADGRLSFAEFAAAVKAEKALADVLLKPLRKGVSGRFA